MEIWVANFLWIALGIALLGWILIGMTWRSSTPIWMNASTAFILSCVVLTTFGGLAAISVHISSLGFARVFNALAADFFGGNAYFFEIGFETAALWLPVVLIRVAVLSVRDFLERKRWKQLV